MNSSFEQALIEVWRQVLVENVTVVELGAERYPVRRTPKRRLREVDFVFDRNKIRGLEQNPDTKSRWAQMARAGKKVMQFLSEGRYVANVVDGKVLGNLASSSGVGLDIRQDSNADGGTCCELFRVQAQLPCVLVASSESTLMEKKGLPVESRPGATFALPCQSCQSIAIIQLLDVNPIPLSPRLWNLWKTKQTALAREVVLGPAKRSHATIFR
jgi:hypothetical protein